jgi:flagellar assembly protein FliH
LFRLMGRDRLKEGDVRPYVQSLNGESDAGLADRRGSLSYRQVQLESLDLIQLGPYLLSLAAEERAQDVVTQAQAQVEEIRNEALRQGTAQGREQATQEILPSLVAFADAAQALIVFEERLISRYTGQIVQLALEIAEKIIGQTMHQDPQMVESVLERAKREVADARQIRIWLHPTDFQLLAEARPDLVKMGDEAGRKIDVAASEEISRGGCRLETEIGLVDATIPTQLDEIRRQLLGESSLHGETGQRSGT